MEVQRELASVTREVEQGKITPSEAADRIIELREEMESTKANTNQLRRKPTTELKRY